ncbi:MAG: hypothetical protein KA715_10995 [Xanthomonadaceae bacterium]|nr:hypothetical protein [Xanthomonadaceae bacterium]
MDNASSNAPYLYVNSGMQVVAAVSGSPCSAAALTFTSATVLQVGVSYRIALIAFNYNAASSSQYFNGVLDPNNGGASPVVGQTCTATTSRMGNSMHLVMRFQV